MNILILLTGFALRAAQLVLPRSFWVDEWFTIGVSRQDLGQVLISAVKDVHPPLQFLIFHFGGYRFFPFLAGVLSLYFFHKLSKDKLATFLFAISPYFMHLSGETRGYGFLCLFSVLVLLGYRWAFPMALFTEHYAWFLLLVVPFALWFLPFLAGSACLIWFQTTAEGVFSSGRGFEWSFVSVIKKLFGLLLQFGGGIRYSFLTPEQALSAIKTGVPFLFVLPAVFLFFSRNKKYLKLFFIPLIMLFLFYPIRLNARYLPFCGLAYILLITEGYREISKRVKVIPHLIMGAFIAANILSAAWLLNINYDPYHREDYIGAAEYLNDNIKPGDGLIGCRQQAEYYLHKSFPENGNVIWEIFIGNPDFDINLRLWKSQEKSLKRKITHAERFGTLVWVIKYEPAGN